MRMLLMGFAVIALAACEAEPVGRRCDLGPNAPPNAVVVQAASLDCSTRMCLGVPGADAMCTDTCATDDDCPETPGSPCKSGFTCAPVLRTGQWSCTPLCVCKDDLDPSTAGYCELVSPKM